MELIPHEEFGRLRLADFAPDTAELFELEDWEYLDRLWIGEAIGFTEWLRPMEAPDVLGALSLDLSDLPGEISENIFKALHLPLTRGLNFTQVTGTLGEPTQSQQFTSNQICYDFICGDKWKYEVSCTIRDDDGLSYVTVVSR